MCRIAAHAGPPAPLSSLLYDPPHSLEVQAYRPREQLAGTVNVDGTGIAWWPGTDDAPLRYATHLPPWSDANLLALSRRLSGRMLLAAVRSATPGLPVGPDATAPFVHGDLALVHNGYLESFRQSLLRSYLNDLSDDLLAQVDVVSDSKALFLSVIQWQREHPDAPLADAVVATVRRASKACEQAGVRASLNLLVGDGRQLVATRHALGRPADPLRHRSSGPTTARSVLIASESLDDEDHWTDVPTDHFVVVDPMLETTVAPLGSS